MVDLNKMDYIEKGAAITDKEIITIIVLTILLALILFFILK